MSAPGILLERTDETTLSIDLKQGNDPTFKLMPLLEELKKKGKEKKIELQLSEQAAEFLIKETLLKEVENIRQVKIQENHLTVKAFFGSHELKILKYLTPLLQNVEEISCIDSIALEPTQLIALAPLCPNVTKIRLNDSEKFGGPEMLRLKKAYAKLAEITTSSYAERTIDDVSGKGLSDIISKLSNQGCTLTIPQKINDPSGVLQLKAKLDRGTAERKEKEMKKRLDESRAKKITKEKAEKKK